MTLPPFQAFLDAHREPVYRFLVAAVGPDEADDCFQETFMAAMRAYPRLRPASNVRAWVLTIAQRKALDSHRARGRRALPVEAVPEVAVEPVRADDGEPALWGAVRELPPKQRAAILHRFAGDLGYVEIGRALGCSEAAARRNVHEGLTKLRGRWAA